MQIIHKKWSHDYALVKKNWKVFRQIRWVFGLSFKFYERKRGKGGTESLWELTAGAEKGFCQTFDAVRPSNDCVSHWHVQQYMFIEIKG